MHIIDEPQTRHRASAKLARFYGVVLELKFLSHLSFFCLRRLFVLCDLLSHFLQSLPIQKPNPCNNTHKTNFNSKMTNASTTVKIVVSMVVAAALVATRMSSSEVRTLEEMVV